MKVQESIPSGRLGGDSPPGDASQGFVGDQCGLDKSRIGGALVVENREDETPTRPNTALPIESRFCPVVAGATS